jgi:hypothetical protein
MPYRPSVFAHLRLLVRSSPISWRITAWSLSTRPHIPLTLHGIPTLALRWLSSLRSSVSRSIHLGVHTIKSLQLQLRMLHDGIHNYRSNYNIMYKVTLSTGKVKYNRISALYLSIVAWPLPLIWFAPMKSTRK